MVGGENWLSIQFIMLRRVVNFVLFLFVATVCYGHLWGYDENGREHRPVYLSEGEVESRMNITESQLSPPTMKVEGIGLQTSCLHKRLSRLFLRNFVPSTRGRVESYGRSNLNCEVKALEVPNEEGITSELRTAVQEFSKVLVSDSVPKMLPAKLMAVYMDNPELFNTNHGLVKQGSLQLINYNKKK